MRMKSLLLICICAFFPVHLTYARWPQVDPHAENYPEQSPYSFAGNNPVNNVDPDGRDYYQSASGSVIWQDDNARKITINDEKYKNIGTSYSTQMTDDSYANYYQGQFIATSAEAVDARQIVLNNQGLAGALLSTESPLSNLSQQGLMTDMLHQAQGDFIGGAADFGGTVLEAGGNGLAVAGYVVSATGVGAGLGAAMSGVGNGIARIGTGLKLVINVNDGNYGQAGITFLSGGMNYGVGKIAAYGAAGREAIDGGVNLFFTPMNIMVGNIKYKRK